MNTFPPPTAHRASDGSRDHFCFPPPPLPPPPTQTHTVPSPTLVPRASSDSFFVSVDVLHNAGVLFFCQSFFFFSSAQRRLRRSHWQGSWELVMGVVIGGAPETDAYLELSVRAKAIS